MSKIRIWSILWVGLLCLQCKSDRPSTTAPDQELPSSNGVWIVNEGNFMFGNADICFYEPNLKAVWNERFMSVHGRPLGDVLQSILLRDSEIWMVVNNSSKLLCVAREGFQILREVTGLPSPRYMAVNARQMALVTDLHANGVHILDLVAGRKTGFITISGWNEDVLYHQGMFFVLNRTRGKIFQIDGGSFAIVDSIFVTPDPNSMTLDASGRLWVLGKQPVGSGARLIGVHATPFSIYKAIDLSASGSAMRLTTDGSRQHLYWLQGNVWRMPVIGNQADVSTVVHGEGRNFYALGIDPKNGELYVADAHDYIRRGTVLRYGSNGNLMDQFQAGIIPGGFWFE
jgi:hypothetical protein